MAIKIKQGMSPQAGRLTMPKGTYLSNPSTAADGSLGGGGTTPPQVPTGMMPVGQPQVPQIGVGNFTGFVAPALQQNQTFNTAQQMLNNPLNPTGQAQPGLLQQIGNFLHGGGQQYPLYNGIPQKQLLPNPKTPTGVFNAPTTQPSNSLVGNDIGAAPDTMDWSTIQQIVPGKSQEETIKAMNSLGYAWDWRNRTFVKTGNPADTSKGNSYADLASAPLDTRGRPMVNPYELGASLDRGQRVVVSGGIGVTGGQEYTNPLGETVSQYAVTYPGNGREKSDHYKLTSTIQKDANGNFVKIYSYKLRKVYTRSHFKAQQQRRADARNSQSNQPQSQEAQNTLVNLRANYG